MSDHVYVVIREIADYEQSYTSVEGIHTSLHEAHESIADDTDHECRIETWTTGKDSHQVTRTLWQATINKEYSPRPRTIISPITWSEKIIALEYTQRISEPWTNTLTLDMNEDDPQLDITNEHALRRGGATKEEALARLNADKQAWLQNHSLA